MKLKICILTLLIACVTSFHAHAATSLSMISKWPYTPVASFLHPSPNAVTSGLHANYDTTPLIIWTTGDTVTILRSDTLATISTFRVETETIIHDIHYRSDSGLETLYVAAGKSGLLIYDLSGLTDTPASTDPTLKSSLTLAPDNPGSRPISETETEDVPEIDARGLGYHDNHIFLADSNFGMRAINVSDPENPSEVAPGSGDSDGFSGYKQPDIYGSYRTTGGYTNAAVCRYNEKTYAFMLDYYYGLRVFDVTDPAVIAEPASKDMRTNLLYGTIALVTGLFAAEGPDGKLYAYVTAMDTYAEHSVVSKLSVLSGADTLEEGSIINTGRTISPGMATGIFASGLYGFLTDGDKGLQVIDYSAPPVAGDVLDYPIAGSYETSAKGAYSIEVLDNNAYMVVAENGFQKLDVRTPATPVHVQTVNSPISGDAVFFYDNHAYLLDGDSGLRIFDSSNPSYLTLTGYLENSGPSYDIAVSRNHAFIADGAKGLTIVDVSTKSSPVQLEPSIDTSGTAMAVAMYEKESSTYACVANDGANNYLVIDVTNPESPKEPKAADTTDINVATPRDVVVHGDHACFADDKGLKIVDLKDPSAPAVVNEKNTTGAAVAVAVFENESSAYAFIADEAQGIVIENITDPLNIPATVALIPPPGTESYTDIDIQSHFAFATSGKDGLTVFDITDPATPVSVATYSAKSSAQQVKAFIKDDTLFAAVAEKFNGLVLYRLRQTTDVVPAEPLESSTSTSGCFINSVCNGTLFGKGWINSISRVFAK